MVTTRFELAMQYANIVHAGQVRKGTTIPYISHLMAVASIALEHGASESEAIGALLHDATASVILVSAADKLHNSRAILHDYHTIGDAVWARFSASQRNIVWYYRSLVEAFWQRHISVAHT